MGIKISRKAISLNHLTQLPRINEIRFSADGKYLLRHETVDGKGKIFISQNTQPIASGESLCDALDIRGGIGYGGGEFDVGKNFIVFSTRDDGIQLSPLEQTGQPKHICSHYQSTASTRLSIDERWVLFIFSENEQDGIAVCDIDHPDFCEVLDCRADFYMQPCWHPSGEWVAWAEWNHPYMPWQASKVNLGRFDRNSMILKQTQYISGQKGLPASQPLFSPDGRWLSLIVQDGNWDDLVLYDLDNGITKTLVKGDGFHLRLPEWVQGMRNYVWDSQSRHILQLRYHQAEASLWKVNIENGTSENIDMHPLSWASQIDISPADEKLVFLGSAAKIPKTVCQMHDNLIDLNQDHFGAQLSEQNLHVIKIEFSTYDNAQAFGLFYQMDNADKTNSYPNPLIIHVHGGPTAVAENGFNPEAVFFTSRGFGFAEINYRGSATFGYLYQNALGNKWGIVDVQDTIQFAQKLIDLGLASPEKIALIGSSAGGFTILNTLIHFPGFFKAAVCSYAVSDLVADAKTTHKFEKYYHQFLIGDLDSDQELFISRSPINHVERIRDPLLLFHGDQDRIVDIHQTISIYNRLIAQGVDCEMVIYPGEGHGFRKTETVSDYYARIENFLLKQLS